MLTTPLLVVRITPATIWPKSTYTRRSRPGLLVTSNCRALIRNIMLIQHDEKNPSDCATEPHNITHINDALRYLCITRTLGAQLPEQTEERLPGEANEDYDEEMTGGEMDTSYLSYGGE